MEKEFLLKFLGQRVGILTKHNRVYKGTLILVEKDSFILDDRFIGQLGVRNDFILEITPWSGELDPDRLGHGKRRDR